MFLVDIYNSLPEVAQHGVNFAGVMLGGIAFLALIAGVMNLALLKLTHASHEVAA